MEQMSKSKIPVICAVHGLINLAVLIRCSRTSERQTATK